MFLLTLCERQESPVPPLFNVHRLCILLKLVTKNLLTHGVPVAPETDLVLKTGAVIPTTKSSKLNLRFFTVETVPGRVFYGSTKTTSTRDLV